MVERSSKFLHQVVSGHTGHSGGHVSGPGPPLEDRHLALALLSELAVQRANLSDMLANVKLLLQLWSSGHCAGEDNRLCVQVMPETSLCILMRI